VYTKLIVSCQRLGYCQTYTLMHMYFYKPVAGIV